MAEKLDVYSDLRVPFEVAAWARGHKFNVVAVNISRDIKALNKLREDILALEKQEAEMEARLKTYFDEAKTRMADKV